MATSATATPSAGSQAKTQKGQAQQVSQRPFITGSRELEVHVYDVTKSMTGSQQTLDPYDLVTDNYVSGVYIYVQATAAGNAATVAYTENAPWNALASVTFNDVSNRPIIGPISGEELKCAIKFGGYTFSDDPQDSVLYSAVSGAGATGGSFSFVLHMPIEFVHRNALGSLTNLSNAAVFRIECTLAASTDVYATPPTTLPSVRVRMHQVGWMESAGHDPWGHPASPAPPAVDSVQYWEKQTYTVNSGSQNFRLQPFEGQVRNVIFRLTDSNGSRIQGEADWPDPLRFRYDATVPNDRLKDIWVRRMEELFGYTAARPSTAAGTSAPISPGGSFRDNGTYVLPYNTDFGHQPGAENGFRYMYVSSGTSLRFDGTIQGSGTHTLTVLFNYINPAGGNPLALTGGR